VSCEGRVLAWDLAEQRASLIARHELGHCRPACSSSSVAIWSASVDPSGSVVTTGGSDGTVGIWPLRADPSGLQPARLPIAPARRAFTTRFAGELLLLGVRDQAAQIWDWRTGRRVAELPGHEGWAYGLAVVRPAAGPPTFVTGSRDGSVRFWSEAGSLLGAVLGNEVVPGTGAVNDLAVSPDGRLVAAALAGGEVLVLQVATAAVVARVKAHEGWCRRVDFLDETTVISAGDDGVVQRIAVPSGAITASIRAHDGHKIYDIDRRGGALLTASHDGTVRSWDLRDGSLVRTYVGHPRPVLVVRWHPDGTRFVSGDGDTLEAGESEGRACVWRVGHDTCHDWLIGHRDDVRAAQFIDAARVLTASFDGTVRVWTPLSQAADADPAAELDRRAPACLDAQERRAYLGEPAPEAAARAAACRDTAP